MSDRRIDRLPHRVGVDKPFLILQVRPETDAADDEFAAIMAKGKLTPNRVKRIRLDKTPDLSSIVLDKFAGIIVGGGPGCVSDSRIDKAPVEWQMESALLQIMPAVLSSDFPFMGCCYGIGILGRALCGDVSKARFGEPVGAVTCTLTKAGCEDPVLEGVPREFRAFVGHKEALQALPQGCTHLVASATCPFQMVRHGTNVYATQFHPEADADGFIVRIGAYRNRGYFAPSDAERLIADCRAEHVFAPERVLGNFVARYG